MEYAIVEKKNHRAVHGIFDTRDRAEAFLRETIPLYVARGLLHGQNPARGFV